MPDQGNSVVEKDALHRLPRLQTADDTTWHQLDGLHMHDFQQPVPSVNHPQIAIICMHASTAWHGGRLELCREM